MRKRFLRVLLTIGLVSGLLATITPAASANDFGPFVVNSTGDAVDATVGDGVCETATAGECTLRAAILEAGVHAGADAIHFNIGGGGFAEIKLRPGFPAIVDTVTIDGTTQPGGPCGGFIFTTPCIAIDGDNGGNENAIALIAGADDSVIRGLWIRDFDDANGDAILIRTDNNLIESNRLGSQRFPTIFPTQPNRNGVHIDSGAQNNTIRNNTIFDNDTHGVRSTNSESTGNLIESNSITSNGGDGVIIAGGGHDNTVRDNFISGNGEGVVIIGAASVGNEITENRINNNTALGIDLADNGVTANDGGAADDADTGPNNLQNFPVITNAELGPGGDAEIDFTLDSLVNNAFRVEFFSNSACDDSDHGEGQSFLGSTNVVTDANGEFTGTATVSAPPSGQNEITSTATNIQPGFPRDTSEFSTCETASTADLEVTKSGPAEASGGDQLDYTIEVTNNGPEAVTEATVTDDADADLENIQVQNDGGFACAVNSAQGTDPGDEDVVCTGPLAAGQTRTIELSALVEAGADFPVFNNVSVEATGGGDPADPDLSNNASQVETAETGTLTRCPGFEHLTGHTHIVGTAASETLVASNNDPHVICGLDGDDTIEGGAGNDVLDGGQGDDTVFGRSGDDAIFGRSGADNLRGGADDDALRGGPGPDALRGSSGDDQLFGGIDEDTLVGGNGNDVIRGGADGDTIQTGSGDNIVRAGAGNDTAVGGVGNNNLLGGTGADTLNAQGNGSNILRGGGGNDTQLGAPGAGSSTSFHCGPGGNDTAVLRGGTNAVHPSCENVADQT